MLNTYITFYLFTLKFMFCNTYLLFVHVLKWCYFNTRNTENQFKIFKWYNHV